MKTPDITAQSAMPVPMDRSMPPVMITKVVPTARHPITTVLNRMEVMLLQVKKTGLAKLKIADDHDQARERQELLEPVLAHGEGLALTGSATDPAAGSFGELGGGHGEVSPYAGGRV